MHDSEMFRGLMRKIEEVVREHNAMGVARVTLRLGALSGVSAGHFREHFELASAGTVAEGAELAIEVVEDLQDPASLGMMLESVELRME